MGRYHAQKLARLPGVQLVAAVDADLARAQALGVSAFSDYRAIFGKADAAVIAVPTDRHYEIARDCLFELRVPAVTRMTAGWTPLSDAGRQEVICRMVTINELPMRILIRAADA